MKIVCFGDIYGRVGRKALISQLNTIKEEYSADLVIANVDNITSGRGVIEKHLQEIINAGVDYVFSGDHIVDTDTSIAELYKGRLIRPANFYESAEQNFPGIGYKIIEINSKKIALIHLMGAVFMPFSVYNPFLRLQEILDELKGEKVDISIVDFHKEATAEIAGLGYMYDGKISLLYGTHTHVQTNDEQILEKGTAYITDVGMVGPKDSVIGADFESVKQRFLTGINKGKITQSLSSHYIISGICVEFDDETNKCKKIEKISISGKLK